MNTVSLHPLDLETVHAIAASDRAATGIGSGATARNDHGLKDTSLTTTLARSLAQKHPVFFEGDIGLSLWEAQVDRSFGMLLRPPSRLFIDAGMPAPVVRDLPIRLDSQLGAMGGAYLPPRLVGKVREELEAHLERSVRRLVDAEMDPVPVIGIMDQALRYAHERGLGLFEAQDLVGPEGEAESGWQVIRADRRTLDQDLIARIVAYATPPKQPGLLKRLFGPRQSPNGHTPH